jgi:hypothetical protein
MPLNSCNLIPALQHIYYNPIDTELVMKCDMGKITPITPIPDELVARMIGGSKLHINVLDIMTAEDKKAAEDTEAVQ